MENKHQGFSSAEKLTIAQLLLEELQVDRIEIASARVSEGEFQGVKGIMTWAKEKGYAHQIEVLTLLIMDSLSNG
jgi:D-citramalate synthase